MPIDPLQPPKGMHTEDGKDLGIISVEKFRTGLQLTPEKRILISFVVEGKEHWFALPIGLARNLHKMLDHKLMLS